MKIVHLSDTHYQHTKVKWPCPLEEVDIIIHSGDFSDVGEEYQLINFLEWLAKLPVKYVITIAGNHDKCLDPKFWNGGGYHDDRHLHKINKCEAWAPHHIKEFMKIKGRYFLNDEALTIEGINFYGSPWSNTFSPNYWAFNVNDNEDSKKLYSRIPPNTDVLITHGPAFGKLDFTLSQIYTGSHVLSQRIEEIKPKFHLFGHIHECYGMTYSEHTTFLNSSFTNNLTGRFNTPQVFEI